MVVCRYGSCCEPAFTLETLYGIVAAVGKRINRSQSGCQNSGFLSPSRGRISADRDRPFAIRVLSTAEGIVSLTLYLKNPHSVLAALEHRSEAVSLVTQHSERPHGAWKQVVALAGKQGVPVRHEARWREPGRRRTQRSGEAGRAASAEATVREHPGIAIEMLFDDAANRANGHGLWLALDQIQDTHNIGAIFRTAAFFGVEGLVLTRDRSAPLNATVYDTACGGVETVPFTVQTNLSRALEQAKRAGVWVLGTSEHAEQDVAEIERDRPWLLVLGNEEKGLRRLTMETCDALCRITPRGEVGSLNVSVAAGVLIAMMTGRPGNLI